MDIEDNPAYGVSLGASCKIEDNPAYGALPSSQCDNRLVTQTPPASPQEPVYEIIH